MQSGHEDTLEERYAIKFCFKLGKYPTETYGMLQIAFRPSCMNRASVFEWHKRFKEGTEFVRDDERCEGSKEVNISELIDQTSTGASPSDYLVSFPGYSSDVLSEFRKRFQGKRPALFKSGQWHFRRDNAPVHNSILVTDYLTKMGIKTVPQPPKVQTLFPVTFGYCLSSKAVVMR